MHLLCFGSRGRVYFVARGDQLVQLEPGVFDPVGDDTVADPPPHTFIDLPGPGGAPDGEHVNGMASGFFFDCRAGAYVGALAFAREGGQVLVLSDPDEGGATASPVVLLSEMMLDDAWGVDLLDRVPPSPVPGAASLVASSNHHDVVLFAPYVPPGSSPRERGDRDRRAPPEAGRALSPRPASSSSSSPSSPESVPRKTWPIRLTVFMHGHNVPCVRFHPTAELLATASIDGIVTVLSSIIPPDRGRSPSVAARGHEPEPAGEDPAPVLHAAAAEDVHQPPAHIDEALDANLDDESDGWQDVSEGTSDDEDTSEDEGPSEDEDTSEGEGPGTDDETDTGTETDFGDIGGGQTLGVMVAPRAEWMWAAAWLPQDRVIPSSTVTLVGPPEHPALVTHRGGFMSTTRNHLVLAASRNSVWLFGEPTFSLAVRHPLFPPSRVNGLGRLSLLVPLPDLGAFAVASQGGSVVFIMVVVKQPNGEHALVHDSGFNFPRPLASGQFVLVTGLAARPVAAAQGGPGYEVAVYYTDGTLFKMIVGRRADPVPVSSELGADWIDLRQALFKL